MVNFKDIASPKFLIGLLPRLIWGLKFISPVIGRLSWRQA